MAIVQVEKIRLPFLNKVKSSPLHRGGETLFRLHQNLPIHDLIFERRLSRRIPKRGGSVIRDVQVKVPVSIDVSECQRSAPKSPHQSRIGSFLEMAFSIIDEAAGAIANSVH